MPAESSFKGRVDEALTETLQASSPPPGAELNGGEAVATE